MNIVKKLDLFVIKKDRGRFLKKDALGLFNLASNLKNFLIGRRSLRRFFVSF